MENSEAIKVRLAATLKPAGGRNAAESGGMRAQFRALLGALLGSTSYSVTRKGSASTEADAERAREFLLEHVKAAPESKFRRKYSLEFASKHSERSGDLTYDFGRIVYGGNKAALYGLKIKTLLHDAIEDFGATAKNIAFMFGKVVADSVERMTTPALYILALRHAEITSQFLPDQNLHAHTPKSMAKKLAKLEAEDGQKYSQLKNALKHHYKLSAFKTYDLDEVIIKVVDNIDFIASYTTDIASRRIRVIKGRNLGAPPTWQGRPVDLSTAEIRRTIRERIKFHRALMERLHELRADYKTHENPELMAQKFVQLEAQFLQFTMSKIRKFRDIKNWSLQTQANSILYMAPAPV